MQKKKPPNDPSKELLVAAVEEDEECLKELAAARAPHELEVAENYDEREIRKVPSARLVKSHPCPATAAAEAWVVAEAIAV